MKIFSFLMSLSMLLAFGGDLLAKPRVKRKTKANVRSRVKAKPKNDANHFSANATILVKDTDKAVAKILKANTSLGGYFTRVTSDSISLKVPRNRFKDLVGQFEQQGEVVSKGITTAELGETVVKLRATIKSRREMLNEYLKVLNKTATREELIEAEYASHKIIRELENATGRLRVANHKIKYAEVSVKFNLKGKASVVANKSSNFAWINTVGLDRVIDDFKLKNGTLPRDEYEDTDDEEIMAH